MCTQRSWDIVVSQSGSIIYFKKTKEANGPDFKSQERAYGDYLMSVGAKDMGDNKYWCYASERASWYKNTLLDENIRLDSTVKRQRKEVSW